MGAVQGVNRDRALHPNKSLNAKNSSRSLTRMEMGRLTGTSFCPWWRRGMAFSKGIAFVLDGPLALALLGWSTIYQGKWKPQRILPPCILWWLSHLHPAICRHSSVILLVRLWAWACPHQSWKCSSLVWTTMAMAVYNCPSSCISWKATVC